MRLRVEISNQYNAEASFWALFLHIQIHLSILQMPRLRTRFELRDPYIVKPNILTFQTRCTIHFFDKYGTSPEDLSMISICYFPVKKGTCYN